jgi:plastocyanin
MRRTASALSIALLLISVPAAVSGASGRTEPEATGVSPADPLGRAEAWMPQPPGTRKWIELDYGPYTINPGADLSRMDVEVPGATGYAVGFIPSVVFADGTEAPSHQIHIHHAHWYWLDPEAPGYHRWFYGTGEERTQGSINPSAQADPRYSDGMRFGIPVTSGDRLGFLSMLHNKTPNAMEVFLRVRIQFVYGTHDEIEAEKDWDFQELTPVLIGSTFQAPRTGGNYVYPMDATKKDIGPHTNYASPLAVTEIVPGLGQVWTSPWDGTIVIGAGHSHPGAREVVLSNFGTKDDPCPEDGDIYPGVTAARSRNITRGGVFPSEEFQMGLTQPGWRLHVRKGDRLVLNALYDTTKYAYPDAMSYFGFYIDRSDKPTADEACKVELVNNANASKSEITWTIPNQEWPEHHPMPTCTKCDKRGELPEPGPETTIVHIAGFQYLPGNLGLSGLPAGPPVVERGDTIEFINEDFAAGGVRHSITSCKAPCNGEYVVNYPFHDGVFDSGPLGYGYEDAYVTTRDEPRWSFDTSDLEPGYHSYYCRLHAWMRGGFYIK